MAHFKACTGQLVVMIPVVLHDHRNAFGLINLIYLPVSMMQVLFQQLPKATRKYTFLIVCLFPLSSGEGLACVNAAKIKQPALIFPSDIQRDLSKNSMNSLQETKKSELKKKSEGKTERGRQKRKQLSFSLRRQCSFSGWQHNAILMTIFLAFLVSVI